MKVTVYFDPSCPFSWITSRWLLQVSGHREIDVVWRPFPLAFKNDEVESKDGESAHAQDHRDGLRALRVLMAAQRLHGTSLLDGYSASGMVRHIVGDALDDDGLRSMLTDYLHLPDTLLAAADDTSHDTELKASLDEALAVVRDDVGVPILIFTPQDGPQQGYFGPVLNELPEIEESLSIWDGLVKLATVKSFYELKRTRPAGSPNTASTAKC